jgi:pimeloyl-ACP methyl ester carboxylesterase
VTRVAHHYARVGDVRLHWVEAGSGAPVILLHGFPETHRSWDAQIPALVASGRRVIAPDLRGYGESEQPTGGYDLDQLADDIALLSRQLETGPFSLVGHDWGATIAWHTATRHPSLVSQLIVIDGPHHAVMLQALRRNPRQLRRSWYMFFFQLPVLPELWLLSGRGRNLARLWRDAPASRHAPAPRLGSLWSLRALGGPLRYYRTAARNDARTVLRGERPAGATIAAPVTMIWGAEDSCLGAEMVEAHRRFAQVLRAHVLEGGGHFVHQELPAEVNAILVKALDGA